VIYIDIRESSGRGGL